MPGVAKPERVSFRLRGLLAFENTAIHCAALTWPSKTSLFIAPQPLGPRKHRYSLHRSHLALENTAIHCIADTWVTEVAARAHSIPQERSNGLLEPPLGKELLELPLGAPGRSKWLLEPLLGAPGSFGTPFRAPTRSHRVARACFCATGRSKMRSKKLFEESVLGYTELCDT